MKTSIKIIARMSSIFIVAFFKLLLYYIVMLFYFIFWIATIIPLTVLVWLEATADYLKYDWDKISKKLKEM